MTPKEYKQKIRALERRSLSLISRIEELRKSQLSITGSGYDDVKVQTTPNQNSFVLLIAERIADLERELSKTILERDETISRLQSQILSIPDHQQADILYRHWVNDISLHQHSLEKNMNYDYVRHLHSIGYKAFMELEGEKSPGK